MIATAAISPGTFLVIVCASAVAGSVAAGAGSRGLVIPVVVLELIAGIVIGPQVIGLHVTELISFFSDLGLGLLFFFAGYEIDLHQIAGTPLRLGIAGWVMSLAIAYVLGSALAEAGVVLSLLYTGSALATTAVGMLIPVLSDAGDMRSRFGTHVLLPGQWASSGRSCC